MSARNEPIKDPIIRGKESNPEQPVNPPIIESPETPAEEEEGEEEKGA